MTTYIYGLECPLAQTIRYVGKSVNPTARYRAHVMAACRGDYNHHTARWIRSLVASGHAPSLVVLHEVLPQERWQDVERAFIASAEKRGWRLTNSTAGGEGLDYLSAEDDAAYRANLSAAMKAVCATAEWKIAQGIRSSRIWQDPEISARRAQTTRATYARPEVLARAITINAEINSRPEVRAKKAAAMVAAWTDPAERAKRANAMNTDVRSRMSAAAKARWADPERRSAALSATQSPAALERLRQSCRDRATPEYRAMMAEKTRASWEKRRAKK